MALDFAALDKATDIKGLQEDIEKSKTEGFSGEYVEVPVGEYEVKIEKLEIVASKKGDPMLTCWFKILEGQYKNSMLFMNQLLTQGFQIGIADEFLRSLGTKHIVNFTGYAAYNNLVMDIFEAVEGKSEFLLSYTKSKKDYPIFKIKEIYDVQ